MLNIARLSPNPAPNRESQAQQTSVYKAEHNIEAG